MRVVDRPCGSADGVSESGERGGGEGCEGSEGGGRSGVKVDVADVGGWEGWGEAVAAVDGHAEHGCGCGALIEVRKTSAGYAAPKKGG